MKPQGICIHHSATTDTAASSWEAIRNHHINVNKWSEIGYHFGVEDVAGSVILRIGRPANIQGAHSPPLNRTHLGLVVVGNYNLAYPSTHHLNIAAQACADIARFYKFDINFETIRYHRDVQNTDCPGKLFLAKEVFVELVRSKYNS